MEREIWSIHYTEGCGECLFEDGDSSLPNATKGKFSRETSTENLEREAIVRNKKAMGLLTMTLFTTVCRVIIHSSTMSNPDWSTGLVWGVMGRFKKKFKPDILI